MWKIKQTHRLEATDQTGQANAGRAAFRSDRAGISRGGAIAANPGRNDRAACIAERETMGLLPIQRLAVSPVGNQYIGKT
jgi:hypothetical protein